VEINLLNIAGNPFTFQTWKSVTDINHMTGKRKGEPASHAA
jgi:hypothetical protein